MRIAIDYTAALRQKAGIGRYSRELVTTLLGLPSQHCFTLFAASGKLEPDAHNHWPAGDARRRTVPLDDEWLARLWQRARLPLPVEALVGPQDLFYSPDFVLPPTLPSTRTLLTVHDLSFLHYPDHFVPKLVRYLSRAVPRAIERADCVLADSQATRNDLIELLGAPPDKVEVLYSGVSPRFQPQAEEGEAEHIRTRYGLDERPYVLAVGTVQPRKNYAMLMRAFVRAAAEAVLVIAGGPGWLCEDIFALADQYPDQVRMPGFVDDGDLPALYRGAALLAFPSLYEGFGLPVLEAMACATPVLCSNQSSLPEVAGDAALLLDPNDEEAWAGSIRSLLKDPARRQAMAAAGLARAAAFTWEHAAKQLLGLMERIGYR